MSEANRKVAVDAGMAMAEKFFAKRGNHSEVHLNRGELAGLLAVAWEVGFDAAATAFSAAIVKAKATS